MGSPPPLDGRRELRIVEGEAEPNLKGQTSISLVARRNGVGASLLYRWRRLMLEGGAVTVSDDDDVTSNRVVREMDARIRDARAPARPQDQKWRS